MFHLHSSGKGQPKRTSSSIYINLVYQKLPHAYLLSIRISHTIQKEDSIHMYTTSSKKQHINTTRKHCNWNRNVCVLLLLLFLLLFFSSQLTCTNCSPTRLFYLDQVGINDGHCGPKVPAGIPSRRVHCGPKVPAGIPSRRVIRR